MRRSFSPTVSVTERWFVRQEGSRVHNESRRPTPERVQVFIHTHIHTHQCGHMKNTSVLRLFVNKWKYRCLKLRSGARWHVHAQVQKHTHKLRHRKRNTFKKSVKLVLLKSHLVYLIFSFFLEAYLCVWVCGCERQKIITIKFGENYKDRRK